MNIQYGTAILVWKDRRLLVGQRLAPSGYGQWALPGGKLEEGETPSVTAVRELAEETAIILYDLGMYPMGLKPVAFTEIKKRDVMEITFFFEAECPLEQNPVALEPEKCAEWKWLTMDEMSSLKFWDGTIDIITERYALRRLER